VVRKGREVRRRDFLSGLGLATGWMLSGSGALVIPAHAARPFTWATTGGSWGQDCQQIFLDQGGFAKLTGLSVRHAAQLEAVTASKIMTAGGRSLYDVSGNAPAEFVMLHEAGLVLPYDTALMPNYADVYEEAKVGNYFAAMVFEVFGLTWNTKEISIEPASFETLANPVYKGRVGIPAYGWYGMYWLHGVNKALGGNEDNITPGIQFAAKVVRENKAIIVQNVDDGIRLMEQGEVIITPFWNGRTNEMQANGTPVKFAVVQGTVEISGGFIILKGTPYHKEANEFVNITLDPKLQVEFSTRLWYPPTSRKAVLPPSLRHIQLNEAELSKITPLDWKKVVAHRADCLRRWNEEVIG
jgi:putative spermidine/putrescine transport system substrate-binding protein